MKKFITVLILGISIGLMPIVYAALNGKFSDIHEGAWYSNAINNLAINGIINGYSDGTFKPSKKVNRAELAVIQNRMLNYLASNQFVYCPDRNYVQPYNNLPDPHEIGTMEVLFSNNDLEYENFNNCYTKKVTGMLPGTDVICNQYVNGIKVFYEDIKYPFKENTELYPSGIQGDKISELNLDNVPSMNASDVADLFVNKVNNDPNLSTKEKNNILIGCVDLEFIYYDLNASSGKSPNFTKAWHVNSKNIPFMRAFVNDTTSEIIYYDNGIRE